MCAWHNGDQALRKSAILSSDWQGGLADMCKLGKEKPDPDPDADGHREKGLWCVRKHALECLLVLQQHCDDEGLRTLAGRIFLSLTADENTVTASAHMNTVTEEGSLGDVTEACKLGAVLLGALTRSAADQEARARIPVHSSLIPNHFPPKPETFTPPPTVKPKVIKVTSPLKRPDCVVHSTTALRSILLAQVPYVCMYVRVPHGDARCSVVTLWRSGVVVSDSASRYHAIAKAIHNAAEQRHAWHSQLVCRCTKKKG